MQVRPPIWLWPNILAIDAAGIAIAWQWIFSKALQHDLQPACYLVLGLSVWLTYMADRLFDIRNREMETLLSKRHQFAKRMRGALWSIWWLALLFNVTIAFTYLTIEQLMRGALLLILCLIYTLLNQLLSKYFFPKELCVALIFAGGAIVFQDAPTPLVWVMCLSIICYLNCIIMGDKEKAVDEALKVKSLSLHNSTAQVSLSVIMILSFLFAIDPPVLYSFGFTLLAISVVYIIRNRLSVETFRVVLDCSLLIGIAPIVLFFN